MQSSLEDGGETCLLLDLLCAFVLGPQGESHLVKVNSHSLSLPTLCAWISFMAS